MSLRTQILLVSLLSALTPACSMKNHRPDGSGTIECTQVRVAAEVTGRIVQLAVEEGDSVTNGQVLAQIDPSTYMMKRDEAKASFALAGEELKRAVELFKGKAATQRQVDQATATADQAAARLALAEKALADCTVTAPMDGTITVKNTEEGEVVSPGMPLLTLSRLDSVWLSIYMPGPALAGIKLGDKAGVRPDGTDEEFEGVVTYISSTAEFSPKNVQTADERAKLVYRVKITLENERGIFKPGMPADAWLGQAR